MSIRLWKSSKELATLSVPPRRAELFLERLANLDATNEKKVWGFAERFRDLLPKIGGGVPALGSSLISTEPSKVLAASLPFVELQPALRHVWKESVPTMKEAGLMFIAGDYMKISAQSIAVGNLNRELGFIVRTDFAAVPDKFLMVLLYTLKHVHLLRYCANPDCKEPYFVAGRASQIFCSEPCAAPAQKEAKLKWWNQHGPAWRKKSHKRRGKHAKAKKA